MREITVDYQGFSGEIDQFSSLCVGSGHAGLALRKSYLEQLKLVHQECGFKYVRFHGILSDSMGVYSEDQSGTPIYNWQYIDMVYDQILEIGMKPFVELSFMPAALASGEEIVFWWKGNITPPKDYQKWYDLIKGFTEHLTDRYGREELKSWYFEVWNEPNLKSFFSGEMEDYFRLYEQAVLAIKSVDQQYRVGGPATAGNSWITEMINFCNENKLPLDFISTHTYGVEGHFAQWGEQELYLIKDQDIIINDVKKVKEQLLNSSRPELELHYTEWNSSYSSRDPVHDQYIQAPYILHTLKGLRGQVDSMSYWTFSDIFEEAGPASSPFHGGFGLLNLQSLKKPAFYAYKYLNQLKGPELKIADQKAWFSRNEDGIRGIFWELDLSEQSGSNQKYFQKVITAQAQEEVSIKVKNLPAGNYQITTYSIGYQQNDIYSYYLNNYAQCPFNKTIEEELKLNNRDQPLVVESILVKKGQTISLVYTLNKNQVIYIKIEQ